MLNDTRGFFTSEYMHYIPTLGRSIMVANRDGGLFILVM